MSVERARTQKRVLVYGANGVRGGAVVRRLLGDGYAVRAITRDPAASPWRGQAGVETVAADLDEPASLERASAGVDAVVFHLPLVYDRALAARYARRAVDAARNAGVGRLVYQGNLAVPEEPTDVAAFEIDREAAAIVLGGGVPATALRPTVYMDNLLGPWTAPGIVGAGVVAYPIPAEAAASWLGADDAAALVSAALNRPQLAGRTIAIGGPEALTGDDVAARLGAGLDRPLRYQAIPLDAFEAGLAAAVGEHAAAEIAKSYRWDAERGDGRRNVVDPAPLLAALPVHLTPLDAWARAQHWPSAATPPAATAA